MSNAVINETSAITMDGTHLNSNNYNTSCTRSARRTPKTKAEIAKEWMIEEFGFYFERWTVGSEAAKEMLEDMKKNRAVKATGVYKYASTIQRGRWKLSPQGLILDKDFHLMDGQHRLEAVIRSGIPTDFVVAIGIENDMPIDKGIGRSDADSQRIRGLLPDELAMKDNNSIVNALFNVTLSSPDFKSITEEDRANFIKAYADEITFARLASRRGSSKPLAKKAGVQAAILSATICGVDREMLENLLTSINKMSAPEGTPEWVMFRTLNDIKKISGGTDICQLEGMMEEAILDYVLGKPRTKKYTGKNHPYSALIPVREVLA